MKKGAPNRRIFIVSRFVAVKARWDNNYLRRRKINHESNLARILATMGVYDASGHSMTNQWFALTEAPFPVL